MTTPTAIATTDLKLTRTIHASAETLFDIWLDSTRPGGPWFGSKRVIMDAKVDGLFFHAVDHAGRTWAHYGRFITLDRGRTIVHTWMSEATQGLETVVTMTFAAHGENTNVTLHHAGVPDDALGRQHADGWGWMLGMLEDKFAKSNSAIVRR